MIVIYVTIVLVTLLLIRYFYKSAYERPENFPPGPPRLPVYGCYWIILVQKFNDLAASFRILGQKYKTKIVGVHLGPLPAIVVNDPTLMKEMLNREEFDGRVDIILFRLRSFWKKLGIFFTDSYFWQEQRRFSLRYLRDYGFGRRDAVLENVINDEIKDMLDMTINGPKYPSEQAIVKGDLVCMPHYFTIPFMNGVLQVISRNTLPRAEHKELRKLAEGAVLFLRNANDIGGALSLTPWLKDILPNYSGYNALVKGNQVFLDFFMKLVEQTKKTHDSSYDRHFLDMYLSKMNQEQKEKDRTTFSVDQLILTCIDFMLPASSVVANALTMTVEHILLQPEIQDKMHEEIDRVVGKDRLPNLNDRRNMPYMEACIRETMRHDTLVPLGIPHKAMADTTLGGYNIPQETLVNANLTMLHMDESIWGDPQNFRPERFIKNGQLDLASDKSLPFGAGRRLCAGETYARQTMFQVLSAFMQTFKVSTVDGKPLRKPLKRIQGLITTLPDFWVRVTPRK